MSRLDDIIRLTLDLGPEVDITTIAYRETPSWDSVAHLELLTALEDEFELSFEPGELMEMTGYSSIRRIVLRRTGQEWP